MTRIIAAQGKFVYPFTFDVKTFDSRQDTFDKSLAVVEDDQTAIWNRIKYSDQDLLPHVAKYINSRSSQNGGNLFNVCIYEISNNVLQSAQYGLGSGRENGSITYTLSCSKGKIAFDILNVQLYLFRTGMGSIAFEIKPRLPNQDPDEWFDFLSYFRYFGGYRGVSIECSKAVGYDREKEEKIFAPFFPPLARTEDDQDSRIFEEIIFGLLDSGVVDGETEKWWDDIFIPHQFLPFSMLFLKEVDSSQIPILVYQYRKMLHSRQVLVPPEVETSLNHTGLHPYTENQWFVFSLDGGGFISFDPPDDYFFEVELPLHLMDQYFLIFILTIQQRFVLTKLADEVVRVWLTEQIDNEDEFPLFDHLQSTLKAFASLGNYNQVMQRDNLHQVYQKWQEIFQIDQLYQSVNEEIDHISDFLQSKQDQILKDIEQAQNDQTQRLERQINIIMYLIGIPAILFPFIEMVETKGLLFTSLVLIGGVIVGGLLLLFVSREKLKKKNIGSE